MTKDEYVEIAAVLVEKHFPKGNCRERGQAMVLVADLLVFLESQGVIYEPPDPRR